MPVPGQGSLCIIQHADNHDDSDHDVPMLSLNKIKKNLGTAPCFAQLERPPGACERPRPTSLGRFPTSTYRLCPALFGLFASIRVKFAPAARMKQCCSETDPKRGSCCHFNGEVGVSGDLADKKEWDKKRQSWRRLIFTGEW